MMNKEVITLQVGEAGINFGDTVWRQYNIEHDINQHGIIQSKPDDNIFLNFYNQMESGKYTPRTLMIDIDPKTINQLKQSHHSSFYDNKYLISGNLDQDAANIFARGHFTVGKTYIDDIQEALRNIVETCDNLDGFILNHSVGGGTGSGLGALILEKIAVNYIKKSNCTLSIYPFYRNSCVTEAYNALLSTHWFLDFSELNIVFDNKRIYDLCKNKLNIAKPSYNDMNLLMAKVESSLTSLFRIHYGGFHRYYNGFQSYKGDLCGGWCNQNLHFLIPSLAPLHNKNDITYIDLPGIGNKAKILSDGFVRKYHIPFPQNHLLNSIKCYESPLYKDLMNLIYRFFIYRKFVSDISFHDSFMTVLKQESFLIDIPGYYNVGRDDYNCTDDYNCIFINIGLNVHGCTDDKIIWNDTIMPARWKVVACMAWTGGNWMYSMDDRPLKLLPDDSMKDVSTSVVMFANSAAMGKYFGKTMCKTYDKLYSQRAFVHWYVGEGMEEAYFTEARENLEILKNYYMHLEGETTDECEDTESD